MAWMLCIPKILIKEENKYYSNCRPWSVVMILGTPNLIIQHVTSDKPPRSPVTSDSFSCDILHRYCFWLTRKFIFKNMTRYIYPSEGGMSLTMSRSMYSNLPVVTESCCEGLQIWRWILDFWQSMHDRTHLEISLCVHGYTNLLYQLTSVSDIIDAIKNGDFWKLLNAMSLEHMVVFFQCYITI